MRTISAILISITILILACREASPPGTAVISGKLDNTNSHKIYLQELQVEETKPFDSVAPGRDGTFSFSFVPAAKGFYLLKTEDGRMMVTIAGRGDSVKVTGNYNTLPEEVTVTGNPEVAALARFFTDSYRNRRKADSLQAVLSANQDDPGFAMLMIRTDSVFKGILEDQVLMETRFIDTHPDYLASLLVLNYSFGPRSVLTMEENFRYYAFLDSTLMRIYPDNPHIRYHHKRVEDYERVKMSDQAQNP
jgi:hypothetical protein